VDKTARNGDAGDPARLARECDAVAQAVKLAHWIGTGARKVTAGEVLRRADVSAAGAALGVRLPAKVRTAADVPALHRPWCTGVATGLLQISDGEVRCGPAMAHWPPADGEMLTGWLAGFRAACVAESDPRSKEKESVGLVVLAFLVVLDRDGGAPTGRNLWPAVDAALREVCELYGKPYWQALDAASRYADPGTADPMAGLFTFLAAFGAVTGNRGTPRSTALGQWAMARTRHDLPTPASPQLPASDLLARLARFDGTADRDNVARPWLAARTTAGAAREILAAADQASPSLRQVAVAVADSLGDDALPAWREMRRAPRVGPHARAVLASAGGRRAVGEADRRWLAVDWAAAALADSGPDEALTRVDETMPGSDLDSRLAAVRASGHPAAESLARALAEFAASGAPRSVDQVIQLKVTLARWRPPIWRRVLVPAATTLGGLHRVIQILYGWDGDHLHNFEVGDRRYSDPFFGLEEETDEEELRVSEAFQPGVKKIAYTYDFGADWQHEITLEKRAERQPGQPYPACIAFSGDSPVEYWDEDDPSDPEPFSLSEVNHRLAADGKPDGP
jgi:Plasmid pRiA4b ORF-3-like protein